MSQILINEENLLRYGISSELAQKAASNLLTLGKIRSLSLSNITSKFGMNKIEAEELKKCVKRQPIDTAILGKLLNASNFTCCMCKGIKSFAFIVHHIIPHEQTQDNSYDNLIVLCPADHDLAHRAGALTLGITKEQLLDGKLTWEVQVKASNVHMATRVIDLDAMLRSNAGNEGDAKTLGYLMEHINFTSLQSNIYNLPLSVNVDFMEVPTYMQTLVVDRPHAYPFKDSFLQKVYDSFLEKYANLYKILNGNTNGVPNFVDQDSIGSHMLKRNRSAFDYQEDQKIANSVKIAKGEFESSYLKLIEFLRQYYPQVQLDSYRPF